jgi:hypothetical protein
MISLSIRLQKMRESHYEEDEKETAEKLNTLFEKKPDLEKYLKDIRHYLEKRKFEF